MADAVDSKSTAGNGVGVQVPSRAACNDTKTLKTQCFQGFIFYIIFDFIPMGENRGEILTT